MGCSMDISGLVNLLKIAHKLGNAYRIVRHTLSKSRQRIRATAFRGTEKL
jgi:hypothetical protein